MCGPESEVPDSGENRPAKATAGRVPMTRKEPQLHTTPEALARAVVRTRPYLGPERINESRC